MATFTWAKYQPRRMMNKHDDPENRNKQHGKPFPPTCGLPKNAVGDIARMCLQLTTSDANPLRLAPTCPCDG